MLIDYYLPLKHTHIALVLASVSLFVARATGALAGAAWPISPLPRWGSVVIDTLLTGTGAMLWWLLAFHPLRETWLGAKLALIVVYVLLGSMALRHARGRAAKTAFLMLALLCVTAIAATALLKDPRAPWHWLFAAG